jgi:hypothetical protein
MRRATSSCCGERTTHSNASETSAGNTGRRRSKNRAMCSGVTSSVYSNSSSQRTVPLESGKPTIDPTPSDRGSLCKATS